MNIRRSLTSALPLFLLPLVAAAHPGHSDFPVAAGALHPLTGWDHLAALLAVGAWSAGQPGRARALIPATFLAFLAIGSVLGPVLRVPAGVVEQGIAASLLVMGLVLAFRSRVTIAATATLAAAFAAFHGAAHGLEAPEQATGFIAGFLAASAALIGVGFVAASLLAPRLRGAVALRVGGALVAGGGLYLLA